MRRGFALALAAGLGACKPAAPSALAPIRCPPGTPAELVGAIAAGRPAEATMRGRCLAAAARRGDATAARILAAAYQAAMLAAPRGAALSLDLFGRRVAWLAAGAAAGDAGAERALAAASDLNPRLAMPDMALAWYQRAAQQGDLAALAALRAGVQQRRLRPDRLYDFHRWLNHNAARGPAYRAMLRMLDTG
ncbi:MAG: hypothetical protein KGK11_11885 [Sphingomonadales bacterium]|nr:hypothetical protein [Sphingomonadales bacterium]